jgi:hypothetical protein
MQKERTDPEGLLETRLLHLLQRMNSVTANRLDTLGVKLGCNVRRPLVLETDVSLLGEENAGEVNLGMRFE